MDYETRDITWVTGMDRQEKLQTYGLSIDI